MKKLFVLLVAFILTLGGYASPSNKYQLLVKTTEGVFTVPLSYSPIVLFTDTEMIIKSLGIDCIVPKTKLIEFVIKEVTYYTVTWLNYDGTELWAAEWTYGSMPEYHGAENPTRPTDDKYEYSFSGWEPAISPVVCDAYYTAKYDSIPLTTSNLNDITNNNFQCRWLNKNTLELISNEEIYDVKFLTVTGILITNKFNMSGNLLYLEDLHSGLYLLQINNKLTIKITK